MRPVVGQQRERDAAELFGPDLEAGQRVGADLQNFYIQLLEFFVVLTEPVYLIFSSPGKRKRQETDQRAAAAECGQREFLVGMGNKGKVGRGSACLKLHADSP